MHIHFKILVHRQPVHKQGACHWQGINPRRLKVFGTHTWYQGGGLSEPPHLSQERLKTWSSNFEVQIWYAD